MTKREGESPAGGETGERLSGILARIGCGVTLLGFLTAVCAGLGNRLGLWGFLTGFTLLRWAVYAGCAGVLLGLAAVITAVRHRRPGSLLLGLAGAAVALAVVAVPVSMRLSATSVPAIHDITTDIDRPPQFVAILPLRTGAPNPAAYAGGETAVKQRAAYPDVRTVILNVPSDQAFSRALDAARSLGWRIVAAVPAEGRIEATDTTFWFGFIDDIVIRVTPAGYRSLVDIRSVSRVGRSDVGTNAKRIRAFMARVSGAG
jgi:hypothetical protein